MQIGGEKHAAEVAELMEKVPALRQRIAGKSIPLEVSVRLTPARATVLLTHHINPPCATSFLTSLPRRVLTRLMARDPNPRAPSFHVHRAILGMAPATRAP